MSECRRSYESFEAEEEGKINRKILNGYWIWWCYEHNQPMAWCIEKDLKQQRDDLLKLCEEFMERADNGAADFDDPEPGSIFLRAAAIIAKAKT